VSDEKAAPDSSSAAPGFVEADPARPIVGPPSRTDRARSAAYKSRFVIIYSVLAILAGGAVGAFVVILSRPEAPPQPRWSTWAPTGSDQARAKQVADHVSHAYKLQNGQQLAAALVGPPQVSAGENGDVPVSAIAIRPDTSTGKKEESDIEVIGARNSLQYILCGLGANCSIKGGTATEARHALLRREALELALYTFKYVHGVDAVSVFLPPRPDMAAAPTSVFLRKRDLTGELSRPLARTIGVKTPTIGAMSKPELETVDRITQARLYSYEYQQAQDGSAVLVYAPVVLGT
jgi:hypothetical protein